jgi:glycosyltransferase involved in cell wall biosynthesis
MRAGLKGWNHVVDDSTLIRHTRSASFGEEKVELMREGRRRIDERYPSYTKEVSAFVNGEQLTSVHHGVETLLDRVRAKPADGRPRVLYVLSTRSGGTPQTNQDLMTALEDRVDAFVLHCDTRNLSLSRLSNGQVIEIRSFVLRNRLKGFPHRSEEYDREVADWMVKYGVELVHVRHISRHSLGLIEVAKALRIPVVFSFHDFYTVCPSVNLLDETGRNCGGTCTSTDGDCTQPLWKEPDFPPLKHRAIHEWKRMLGGSLQLCDAFVTTSPSAAATLKANYPFLEERRFLVIPHGRDFAEMQQLSACIEPGEPLRLLVPGNLSRAKGLGVVRDLSERAREHEIEMHLLGELNEKIEGPNVINHGPYEREEFARKVSEIKPHVGGIFSICQETFSHTLTELWSCAVPVIGFDIGAVGERMKRVGGGWLAAEPSAAGVLELLRTLRRRPELQKAALQKIGAWQAGEGRHRDCHAMANEYYDVYRAALEARSRRGVQAPRRPRVAVMSPGTTTQGYRPALGPGSTHVRLGEKTRDRLDRPVRYDWVPADADPRWLASAFDAVIVQRTALDERAADALIEQCEGKCPLIIELDDFLLSADVGWSSYRDYSDHREALKKLIDAASLVMTSTEELKARLSQFNNRITVIPNVLSERLWLVPLSEGSASDPSFRVLRKPRNDRETRAIYMGTWTHGDDLNILRDAVADVRISNPNFRFFLVGVTKTQEPWYEQLKAPHVNYPLFVAWFRRVAALMDFAVAPLVDTEFNRAKSSIKLLEYSAANLPVIASEVPPYRDEIENGVTGLLAKNSASAWTEALRFACENPDEMREMAARMRQAVLADRLVGRQIPAFDAAVLSTIEEFHQESGATGWQAGGRPASRSVELPAK